MKHIQQKLVRSKTTLGLMDKAIRKGLVARKPIGIQQKVKTAFFGKSFISIDQIQSREQIQQLFEMALVMEAVSRGTYKPLKGYRIAAVFYEASTRTSMSFQSAGELLGAQVIIRDGMGKFSSVTKGESLEDTIHAVCQVTDCDMLILRHHSDDSAQRAMNIASLYNTPVINAGSGTKEHPTQALLDLYTIRRLLGRTNKLRVMMIGDMKYGRTNKSLAKLLAFMDPNVELIFVAPDQLRLPREFVVEMRSKTAHIKERDEFVSLLPSIDVVYMTRVQKERFPEGEEGIYEKVKNQYIFTAEHARMMKKDSIIMHPLPRVNEIEYEVDLDPRAAYFSQMGSGLYIRMALLHEILLGHGLVV